MPGGAVDPGHQARMNVLGGTAAPFFAARNQLDFDHALGAEVERHRAVTGLAGRRHHDAHRALQCRRDFGIGEQRRKVGRADFFLTLGNEDEVDRQLDARVLERMQRGEEGHLRSLLVDRAAAHQRLTFARSLDDLPLERGRRPLGRIVVLDVVHEVNGERVLRPGVERCKHARHAAALDDLRLLKPGVQRELAHVLGALRGVDAHVGDGRQSDPCAQSLDRTVLVGLDGCDDFVVARIARCRVGRRCRKGQGQNRRAADHQVPVESHRPSRPG